MLLSSTQTEYDLYIDESGHETEYKEKLNQYSQSRFLTLTGVLIKKSDEKRINKEFSGFKKKYGIENRTLHLNDIKNNSNGFEFLKNDHDLKTQFYNDLRDILKQVQVKIIIMSIDQYAQKLQYKKRIAPSYNYMMTIMVERIISEITGQNGTCKIFAEKRGNQDVSLLRSYETIYNTGTKWGYYGYIKVSSETIKQHIKEKIIFFDKKQYTKQQIYGLEIADLLSNPAFRYCKSLYYKRYKDNKDLIFDEVIVPEYEREIVETVILNKKITLECF